MESISSSEMSGSQDRFAVEEVDTYHHQPILPRDTLSGRELLNLLSCRICNEILKLPVTTQCGLSYCRKCILRAGDAPSHCPNDGCHEYSDTDCPVDISLQQVVLVAQKIMETQPSMYKTDPLTLLVELKKDGQADRNSSQDNTSAKRRPRSWNGSPPRVQRPHRSSTGALAGLDLKDDGIAHLSLQDYFKPSNELIDELRSELTEESGALVCQICYHRFLDPVTTRCGHTFCRNCLTRSLDSLPHCPACRTEFEWAFPTGAHMHHDPLNDWEINHILTQIINYCWSEELAARRKAVEEEEKTVPPDMDIPIFVCCVSYPSQPTYLRVFEPRYRLMLRRVLRTPSRTFGMVLFRANASPPLHRFGTVLQIDRVVYPAKRDIIIKTTGLHRFKVKQSAMKDGYWVSKTETLVDQSLLAEGIVEQNEVGFMRSLDPALRDLNFDPDNITLFWLVRAMNSDLNILSRLLTKELRSAILEYIRLIQTQTDPIVQQNIIEERGEPPTDAAELAWWFASVMGMSDDDGVELLGEVSARERMKILVCWIGRRLRIVRSG